MVDLVLSTKDLGKTYPRAGGSGSGHVIALAGIDVDVRRGSVLAVVGRSGSGKSTLARLLAGLEQPSSGTIDCRPGAEGNTRGRTGADLLRSTVQLVFQETDRALNPRFTAVQCIEEPLRLQTPLGRPERLKKAIGMMDLVGLPITWAERRPGEFSGGQRKRIAIARSLAAAPEVLVLDEPFAGLDLSAQALIVNVLLAARQERHVTLVLILHDLAVTAALAEEIAVLEAGRIVDRCIAGDICNPERHPQTQALVLASFLTEKSEP